MCSFVFSTTCCYSNGLFIFQKIRTVELDGKTIKLQIVSVCVCVCVCVCLSVSVCLYLSVSFNIFQSIC